MKIFTHKVKTPKPVTANKSKLLDNLGNFGHDPHIDWVLIVMLSTIISIVLVVMGVLAYMKVGDRLAQKNKTAPVVTKTIDAKMLDYVVGKYDARVQESASLNKNFVGPVDPSL